LNKPAYAGFFFYTKNYLGDIMKTLSKVKDYAFAVFCSFILLGGLIAPFFTPNYLELNAEFGMYYPHPMF